MPRELLGAEGWSVEMKKCPPWGRGVEVNTEPQDLHPLTEGALEPSWNDCCMLVSQFVGFSLMGLNSMLENPGVVVGTGAAGNMMAQLFGNVSTIA